MVTIPCGRTRRPLSYSWDRLCEAEARHAVPITAPEIMVRFTFGNGAPPHFRALDQVSLSALGLVQGDC